LRRNPDLKWRQTPEDVAELNVKQTNILARAAKLTKAGGRLIYATCSLLRDENEAIAEAFLSANPEFSLVPANEVLSQQQIKLDTGHYLKLLPHLHGTDGFFAAVFERKAELAKLTPAKQAEAPTEPIEKTVKAKPAKGKVIKPKITKLKVTKPKMVKA